MKIYQLLTNIFTALSIFFSLGLVFINAQTSIYTIPAGTTIRVKMDNEINSKVSSINDTFTATVSSPVAVNEIEMIPVGSIVEGRIINVKAASLGKNNGILEVKFETLRLPDESKRSIEASLVNQNLTGNKSSAFTAISILGGTAAGAVIGILTGKGKGAVVGAGVGAGIGSAASFLRKGKEARIKANEEFEIRLNKEVTVPVKDF